MNPQEKPEARRRNPDKDHFPENYNNHSIDLNKIRLENWQLSEEEMAAAGKSNNALGNAMSQSASGATGGALKIQDNSMVKLQLDKYIAEKKIAHELIKNGGQLRMTDLTVMHI